MGGKSNMSQVLWGILIYGAAWFGCRLFSRVLYRGYRKYAKWEIHEAYPSYKHALSQYQRLSIGAAILLLLSFPALISMSSMEHVHILGIVYGIMLLVDAAFSWRTGIRPMEPHFIIEEDHTWRSKLQLGIASAYVAVPALCLLSRIG